MPLAVTRVVTPQFGENAYLVRTSEEAPEAVVVDPGGEPGPILAELERGGATLAAILVTHTDVDHIMGVADLHRATGAEVWVPAGEAEVLRTGAARAGGGVSPHDPEHVVADGDVVSVAGLDFDVVGIPGHSVDHVAFCVDGSLFSGDLLFASSVGRVDLPGGDWAMLVESIRRLLDRYGPDAVVYPGHGDTTTLGSELESNPFLGELRAPG
jgi:glyoxylase-like metal-dependent hydrolase (beta-lactamase superfamily II)